MLAVYPLLRDLIVEVAAIEGNDEGDGYPQPHRRAHSRSAQESACADRRTVAAAQPAAAPCKALYVDPADTRSSADWAKSTGMSSRTYVRRGAARSPRSQAR